MGSRFHNNPKTFKSAMLCTLLMPLVPSLPCLVYLREDMSHARRGLQVLKLVAVPTGATQHANYHRPAIYRHRPDALPTLCHKLNWTLKYWGHGSTNCCIREGYKEHNLSNTFGQRVQVTKLPPRGFEPLTPKTGQQTRQPVGLRKTRKRLTQVLGTKSFQGWVT